MKRYIVFFQAIILLLVSCNREENTTPAGGPKLVFKFAFDSTQARLNNLGLPTTIASGRAAQSPKFNKMSAHYIELSPSMFTPLSGGTVIYKATETNIGGANAIDFSKSIFAGQGESFFSIPIKDVKPGTYEWLRVSLAYQNYDIKIKYSGNIYDGTVASFIGFNTYIKDFTIKTVNKNINANRRQGYWAFEGPLGYNIDGLAPEGATTVPNPIFATSVIPAGSCVVTGAFVKSGTATPITITGNETSDIIITVSLSTNKSFEWKEKVVDGLYEPAAGDSVIDMGIRGMIPKW